MARNDLRQIRSFIAVELGSAVAHRAAEVIKKLKTAGADIRWAALNQIHLTLKFLGNIDARDIVPISRLLQTVVRDFKPIELGFSGVGVFPDRENPKTIWLGVREGLNELTQLQTAIEDALKKELGFSKERRKFSPHITLGRVEQSTPELVAILAELANHEGDVVDFDEVALFSSHLGPKGPSYEILSYAVLGLGERPRMDLDDDELDAEEEGNSDAPSHFSLHDDLDEDDDAGDDDTDDDSPEEKGNQSWRQSATWKQLNEGLSEIEETMSELDELSEMDWDDEDADDDDLEEDEEDLEEDDAGDEEGDAELDDELDDDTPIPPADPQTKAKLSKFLNEPEEPRTVIDDALLEKLLGKRNKIEPSEKDETPGDDSDDKLKRQ
jgi:2'-5' RNA ligase